MKRRSIMPATGFLLGVLLVLAFALPSAQATLMTFTGIGFWNTTSNWNPNTQVPQDGDDVVIRGTVTNFWYSTPTNLSSYTLSNGFTHTFVGTNIILGATNVYIYGTLTHGTNTATAAVGGIWYPDSLLQIVASNVTVYAAGQIGVDYKGYQNNPAAGTGYGPGGGNDGFGASYGGGGGIGAYGSTVSKAYGVSNAPIDPGSAGGSHSGSYIGGAGGGAVHIIASGTVTVNGTISAVGGNGNTQGGSGSGGSIYIECGAFGGSGLVKAPGGVTSSNGQGGGGGGRVAVLYTNATLQSQVSPTPSVQFNLGGRQAATVAGYTPGEPGTLYLTDSSFWPTTYTSLAGGGQVMIPGFTSWNPASLTISNSGVKFLNVSMTIPGGVTVTNGGELILTNSCNLTCAGSAYVNGNSSVLTLQDHAALSCGGNLIVTNTGMLYTYSGLTNNTTPPDNAVLVSATGTLFVGNGCYIFPYCHPTNGGSALFVVSNFTVAAGGKIDADAKGFGPIPGSTSIGYGPGAGAYSGGAFYGGLGGFAYNYSASWPTPSTYGPSNAPVDAGSAGGSWSSTIQGGRGGGAVRVRATGLAQVDGTISANGGTTGTGAQSGGGSGGGIYIECGTVNGAGTIRAKGTASSGGGGSGGGGRIAVVYTNFNSQTSFTPTILFDASGVGSIALTPRVTHNNASAVSSTRGTLYLADTNFLPKTTTPVSSGGYQLIIPNFTSWSPASLTIATNTALEFPPGFILNVAGAFTIASNAVFQLNPYSVLTCGSLMVSNASTFAVFAGFTNKPGGSGVYVNVTAAMTVQSNASVYVFSATNGGSALFNVGSLAVALGGQLNADRLGWFEAPYAGSADTQGQGPGGGSGYAGAGYGGQGGSGTSGSAGGTYGSTNFPSDPGSGGGQHYGYMGGSGGGLLRILSSGKVQVDGVLTANGQGAVGTQGGGGSGGGIYIDCQQLLGTGWLCATGGPNGGSGSGSGGGGRIAVWATYSNWNGSVSVTNGGGAGNLGVKGTYVFGIKPISAGTMIMIR